MMTLILVGSVLTLSLETTWPRNVTLNASLSLVQVLLSQSDPTLRQRVRLHPPHSSINSGDNLRGVPSLPLPSVRPQLTRTVLSTGLNSSAFLWINQQESLRVSSSSSSSPSSSPDNLTSATTRSLTRAAKATNEDLIIGATEYIPSKWRITESAWHCMERVCALGSEQEEEEFQPAVLFMDRRTDNTDLPSCPMTG